MEGHPVTANYISRSNGTSIFKEDPAFFLSFEVAPTRIPLSANTVIQSTSVPSLAPLFVASRGYACVSYKDDEVGLETVSTTKKVDFFTLYCFHARGPSSSAGSQGPYKKKCSRWVPHGLCALCNSPPRIKRERFIFFLFEFILVHVQNTSPRLNTYYVNLQNKVFRKYMQFLTELKIFLPIFREIYVYFCSSLPT